MNKPNPHSVNSHIFKVLCESTRPMRVCEIHRAVIDMDNNRRLWLHQTTVMAALSKAVKSGRIAKVGFGCYSKCNIA